METVIVVVVLVILAGVAVFLVGSMVRSIRRERRSAGVKRIWANFGLSLTFCVLFFVSWFGQGMAEWGTYQDEQQAHHDAATAAGFVVHFGQSTLENWQSEFLQLFSFVVLAALLIHRGSAESKDGEERIEALLRQIKERLDELDRA